MIIGIGARRGISSQEALDAIYNALAEAGRSIDEVQALASAKLKENEAGLHEAAAILGIGIRFIDHEELNNYDTPSASQAARFGLTGVAEPAALSLSEKKQLILRKKVYGRVTIAIAE
ncbi:cobalamin biosynthesis protein [Methanolobus sp. WCC5]|jgi:cobalt-precorrin 5A hydrolase|uniref:cobalamin biosynthesis protein n=1 Tax=Methanolobus sp. WCC5 TaxID=3125785 RepID=UPI00325398F3